MKAFEKHTIIIGAGAAGFMCAIEAAKRGRKVLLVDHSKKIGEKIRISGGGRCNFTNIYASPENYISKNPHFCKSALAQYSPYNFIGLVEEYGIAYHEKKLGQQFCDDSSTQIIDMLFREARKHGVEIFNNCKAKQITALEEASDLRYELTLEHKEETKLYQVESLVIATGGLSIPQIGATNFGHITAERFGLKVTNLEPALVPFTFDDEKFFAALSGVALDSLASANGTSFRENILFTHKGLTGPAILQVSSYWNEGEEVTLKLLPDINLFEYLTNYENTKKQLKNILKELLPERFVEAWTTKMKNDFEQKLAEYSHKELQEIAEALQNWRLKPDGTEGYKKAEVTVGGVDTDELSSKTMEAKKQPGLYFIGEVVDVTGWLGGYNFQWAWASGFAAGQYC